MPHQGPGRGWMCRSSFSMMGHATKAEGGERDSLAPLAGAIKWAEPMGKWSRLLGGRLVPPLRHLVLVVSGPFGLF